MGCSLARRQTYSPTLTLSKNFCQKSIGFKNLSFITDPFSTEDSKDNHEAVKEVDEVPSWHYTVWPHALLGPIVIPVQLHAHHGKDEDDDADHEGEVGKTPDHASHDGQDVI